MKIEIRMTMDVSGKAARNLGYTGNKATGLILSEIKHHFEDVMTRAFDEFHAEMESQYDDKVAESRRAEAITELQKFAKECEAVGVDVLSVLTGEVTVAEGVD